jgi:hypothetical protein
MRNLSLADREWLHRIHVDAKPRRFTDGLFLRSCGVEAIDGGRSSDGISRLLQIYVLDGTWPEGIAEEREAELRESCFARFTGGCQETTIENLLAAYEQQADHEAEIQACADRIAKHEAPIQLDGTQRLMVGLGLDPYDRSEYLRLAFMGHPPAELDGEVEAELSDGIRLQDEDDIGDAPSAGFCGEPSHGPAADPDEDDEED